MNGAEAQKLRVLESWNHPKHALLFRVAKPRLEADEIPHATRAVFHAQLDDGMCPGVRTWVLEADGLQRTESERVASPSRHLLHRHTPLEIWNRVEVVRTGLVRLQKRIEERVV